MNAVFLVCMANFSQFLIIYSNTKRFKKQIRLFSAMARVFNEKSLGGLKLEEKQRVCTDCGSKDIVYENGELYCKKCGLVLD